MSERIQRRLATIVSDDVVGYSRLISANEAGTLSALRSHKSEVIDLLIAKFGGRIVKTMGVSRAQRVGSSITETKAAVVNGPTPGIDMSSRQMGLERANRASSLSRTAI